MHFGVAALVLVMTLLSFAAFQGIWKFQKLTKNIRDRSIELPLAAELNQKVSELRSVLWDSKDLIANRREVPFLGINDETIPSSFSGKRDAVEQVLEKYHQQLKNNNEINDIRIAENSRELEFVSDFRRSLAKIKNDYESGEKVFTGSRYGLVTTLKEDLEKLQHEAAQLPVFMQQRMQAFAENARSEYHRAYGLCLGLTLAALALIVYLAATFRQRIFRPLETLVFGSRQVANGNYDHRIQLDRDDEVSELADALNEMTENFQRIQKDLNQKVQRGTQEVIRSEKMASVGFLAAGIAHEINNPLASIAWSAESLESRVQDILQPEGGILEDATPEQMDEEIVQVKKYLSLIQEEAFRCKGITAGLLDFARMGDAKKVPVNIGEVVQTVIEMIKPMSKYRDRNLHYAPNSSVFASANAQELKQVALNLITNALGSVEAGGTVHIRLNAEDGQAVLTVSDDGCGMTAEIKQHLFEPFFTRRRDGQGTGLGLSITYQIVQEHAGEIEPFSEGPGKGSTFIVRIPLQKQIHQQIEQSHGKKTAA